MLIIKEDSFGLRERENIKKWQALLKELRMENIQLKNELSGIIKKNINRVLLEKAEHFQQRFVQKDLVIDLLRLDINKLLKYPSSGGSTEDAVLYTQTGNDIKQLVVQFSILKDSFYSFVREAEKIT